MKFLESEEFKKEFKKLVKKYRSLPSDLEVVKKIIQTTPTGNGTKHWNVLKHDQTDRHILKMRMTCRSIKGSQFRLIYLYDGQSIEILFIEIYFKGNKEREDKQRIEKYFGQLGE